DTLLLFSDNGSIEILDSITILERLGPGDTLLLPEAFRFIVGNHVVDQGRVVLGIRLKGTGSSLFLKEILHAPVLVSGGIIWDDRPLGNGNGTVEAGEWLHCSWSLFNSGHFRTAAIQGKVLSENHSVLEQVVFENHPVLEPGDSATLTFAVKVANPGKGWHGSGSLQSGDPFTSVVDSFVLITGRYFEDFSNGTSDRFAFLNSSPSPWSHDAGTYASSGSSMRSGKISHNVQTDLAIRFETTETDTLSFSYRISSEGSYDFLRFYVDSILVKRWSGETGWNSYAHILEAGLHAVTWSYQKDANISRGEDASWIDDISFPGSAFRRGDLSLMEILTPGSGPWLSGKEQVKIRVRNTSDEPIDRFTAGFWLNGIRLAEETFTGRVLPGDDVEFMPDLVLDLSRTGIHLLRADVISDTLGYAGNNWLEKQVVRYDYPDLSLFLEGVDHREGVYADVTVSVENAGNIPLDSLRYEIWMDDNLSESGARFTGLDPGERTTETFRLVDSLENLASGIYEYRIRAVDKDSVMTNNEVTGIITWWTMGMFPPNHPDDWLVYPNPAWNSFYLVLRKPAGQDALFEMISLTGHVVKSCTVTKGADRIRISTGSVAPGTYLLRHVNTGDALQ
ncbi:MAG: T9SS type A sorting domain-containing protein, partial [Bacteroidales bacterium]|nr:T9SS type A sorting domain-containing protein [Bacteroidales bacterium]